MDKERVKPGLNSEEALAARDNGPLLPDLGMAAMLLHRVRYLTAEFESVRRSISAPLRFTDGAVIGSKAFVNEAFAAARVRFGARRKEGAKKMQGGGSAAAGVFWSVMDLRVRL